MSEPTLIPCPFCGGEGVQCNTWNLGDVGVTLHAISCFVSRGGCGARSRWCHTTTEAVEAWNRRATPGGGDGWRPIETAPKDEAHLCAHGHYLWVRAWETDPSSSFHPRWSPPPYRWYGEPTHWMPLPAPPRPAPEGTET